MLPGLLYRLRERGVLRVAASYGVICWLVLQIADVISDPLGLPKWVMTSLIVAAALGFPVAIALAWFYEIGDAGIQRDTEPAGIARPVVHGRRRFADVAIIGLLLLAVAVLLVRQSNFGKPPPPENPAIAVLPFQNLSGDASQEYFGDGLAVEVLDRLGRVPGLRVIASASSFSYKNASNQDFTTIASQLGVTTLLTGSVRRDGPKLKVNARLIQGSTGIQLWSGSFDRELIDIFAVQAELAAAVIDAIVPAARGDTVPTQAPTMSLDAHDHYLLGLADMRSRQQGRVLKAIAHFEQAVVLDPAYAQAHAALASALLLIDVSPQTIARAEQAAYKALAFDASLSDAHGALGNVMRASYNMAAENEYKRALELNPNNAIVVHDYAVFLSNVAGRKNDELMARALELDPRAPTVWSNVLTHVLQTQGAAEYRKQLTRAIKTLAGDADGLALIGERAPAGFPLETFELSREISRAGDRRAALRVSLAPLIELGAFDECLARIDEMKAAGADRFDFLIQEFTAAGLKGDAARTAQALNDPVRYAAMPDYRYAVDLFWYVVLNRMPEASAAFAKIKQVQVRAAGPTGSSVLNGVLPALVLLYRAEHRESEIPALVAQYKDALATEEARTMPVATVRAAGIAAALGKRSEAVELLQKAMLDAPLPEQLFPELPWFKSLEGTPGYAEVVTEIARRRAKMRAEIAAMERPGR